MPRFTANPTAGSSVSFVAPEGEYTFQLGKPKAFEIDNRDKGGKHSWGVGIPLRIKGSEFDGKRMGQGVNLYLHTENTNDINAVFLQAAFGFEPGNAEAEAAYKEFVADFDFSYDTDTGEVGSGWAKLEGALINGEVTVGTIESGNRMGQQKNDYKLTWKPAV